MRRVEEAASERSSDEAGGAAGQGEPSRPTLTSLVRRRRADRAFFLRIAGVIRDNERAIERLKK